jgi:hypothetical protein
VARRNAAKRKMQKEQKEKCSGRENKVISILCKSWKPLSVMEEMGSLRGEQAGIFFFFLKIKIKFQNYVFRRNSKIA